MREDSSSANEAVGMASTMNGLRQFIDDVSSVLFVNSGIHADFG